MTIATRERAVYDELLTLDVYQRSPGALWVDRFAEVVPPGATVLDAGCGTGQGLVALAARGYRVIGCDLTTSGLVPEARAYPVIEMALWQDLSPLAYFADVDRFEAVYCTDVLEHLPTAFTMLVVRNLLAIAKQAFFSVSLVPDVCGVWAGTPLHQTVQSFTTWRDQMREVGRVTDARDLGAVGLYWVAPQ